MTTSERVETIRTRERDLINNICVMKFGGTSVGSAEAIERVAGIVDVYRRNGAVVVVVSAMSGVTKQLIEVCDNLKSQNGQAALETVNNLQERHLNTCLQLNMPSLCKLDLQEELNFLFGQLREEVSQGAFMSDERSDSILSFGERLSAQIVAARVGLLAEPVDASAIIETNDNFGDAVPNMEKTKEKVREVIFRLIQKGKIPVVTGFIGATKDGKRTTLERGGSDYTVSIIGRALGAEEVIIWTDVDGVYDEDPKKYNDAKLIPKMLYSEAHRMANNGHKVLYKRTIEPLFGTNIVLRVKNTFNPDFAGTEISEDATLET